jgi:hypothetical protein
MRCRKAVEIKDGVEVEMNGKGGTKRRAIKGICPVCGTKVFRILGKKKEEVVV